MKNYLLKVFAVFVMSLLLMGGAIAQNKQVVYVLDPGKATDTQTGQHPEMSVADFITSLGGIDIYIFKFPNLSSCTQQQLDTLRNADLIVIGRGLGSSNFNGHQDSIWNRFYKPVLSISMFAVRPGTLKWFDGAEDYGDSTGVKKVKVNYPADPVFAGLTMTDDSLEFWEGRWNSLRLNDKVNNGNGTLMATFNAADVADTNLRVAYARFDPFVEFYAATPSSYDNNNHTPNGYRTFIGMASDVSGGNPYNYFGYTFDGQDVFGREVQRLLDLPVPTGVKNVKGSIFAAVYPNPAVSNINIEMANLREVDIIGITGIRYQSLKAKGDVLNIKLGSLPSGIYFVKATDNKNHIVVKRFIKR